MRENGVWRTFERNSLRFLVNHAWPVKKINYRQRLHSALCNKRERYYRCAQQKWMWRQQCIRAFAFATLARGLSHPEGYIRRITYSRQRKGLLAHYAGDVRVAARWARRHHGQVAHDLQHFYPGQHRETSHRRNMATAMEEEEEVCVRFAFSNLAGLTGRILSVLLCRLVSQELWETEQMFARGQRVSTDVATSLVPPSRSQPPVRGPWCMFVKIFKCAMHRPKTDTRAPCLHSAPIAIGTDGWSRSLLRRISRLFGTGNHAVF